MRFGRSQLLERAAVERGGPAPALAPVHPGILERARVLASQSFVARFASTFATIVIVVGVVLPAWPGTRQAGTYAQINLVFAISTFGSCGWK